MKYIVSSSKPGSHYLEIEFHVNGIETDELEVQLPAWRPGRYQLGNFAGNIQKWDAFDDKGKKLESGKVTKDKWKVRTKGVKDLVIKYNYYANKIDAGSTYVDEKQLYINGVNCFLYVPERMHERCELKLDIDKSWDVATGMKSTGEMTYEAADFHVLVDSPLIASGSIRRKRYTCEGVDFHIWMHGECKPDWKKLIHDFEAFTLQQLKDIGEFPVGAYHFIFFILPYRTYHGVEHINSTVIVLGPSYDIMREEGWYKELLGVSSHELFHTWNVKQIRPVEMYPYDYSKENYSKLGYIAEGLTTYYGDVFLCRSGVYSKADYFKRFNKLLERHYYNLGVRNLSVADSSFDTWLDGYQPGAPGRKGSIYIEGALCAFMTDVFIRRSTGNEKSLDDVVTYLYREYACKGKGVGDDDYKAAVEHFAGEDFTYIHQNYIHGNKDYTVELDKALRYLGLNLIIRPSSRIQEADFGFRIKVESGRTKITDIFPGGPAENAGLSYEDELLAINSCRVEQDVEEWLNYFADDSSLQLLIKREHGKVEELKLDANDKKYYHDYTIAPDPESNDEQKQAFRSWLNVEP